MKTNNYPEFCCIGQIIDTSQLDCNPEVWIYMIDLYLASNETNKDNAKSLGKETEHTRCYLQEASRHPVSQLKVDCNLFDRTWLLAASSKFTAFQLLSCIIPLDRRLWGAMISLIRLETHFARNCVSHIWTNHILT